MSNLFFIADPHFGDEAIMKYENRPFKTVNEMNKAIVHNWNKVVHDSDKVFVLGDVSFMNKKDTKQILSKLKGYKVLIMGNHDRHRDIKWWMDVGFNEVVKYPIIVNKLIVLQHEPPEYFNPNTPYFYIYGHVHGTAMYKTITKNSCCACVERWNYTPVKLPEISNMSKLV